MRQAPERHDSGAFERQSQRPATHTVGATNQFRGDDRATHQIRVGVTLATALQRIINLTATTVHLQHATGMGTHSICVCRILFFQFVLFLAVVLSSLVGSFFVLRKSSCSAMNTALFSLVAMEGSHRIMTSSGRYTRDRINMFRYT